MGKNTLNLVDKAIETKIRNSLFDNAYTDQLMDKVHAMRNLSNVIKRL